MLELVVFLCGAAVMVLEIVGARVVAPYLGTSIVVWTSLIGVILASLSLGYWWGGRLADRRPSGRVLGGIILAAAVCVGVVAGSKTLLLGQIAGAAVHPALASLLANLLLFAPAAVLMGMVSPYAVRLTLVRVDAAGRTAGNLYALSTIGSIAGTFLTGFGLIAWLGNAAILLCTAATLALTSLLASRRDLALKLSVLVLLGLLAYALQGFDDSLAEIGVHDVDTRYARILVYEGAAPGSGRTMRVMMTNPHGMQSAMYLDDPQALAMEYARFFRLAMDFAPQARDVLALGGGAYSFPLWLARARPEIRLDVVELDPGVTGLARQYFGLPAEPPFAVIHEDARTYLNRCTKRYDVIFLDVFESHYVIPFHLVSLEAVAHMRGLLKEGGMVVANTIGAYDGPGNRLTRSVAATFRQVFPHVAAYPLNADTAAARNVMLVATAADLPPARPAGDPELAGFLARRREAPLPGEVAPLTDDHAPVEFYALSLW